MWWKLELLSRAGTMRGSPSLVPELWLQHWAQGSCWTAPPLISFCLHDNPAHLALWASHPSWTAYAELDCAGSSLSGPPFPHAGLGGLQRELAVSPLLGDSAVETSGELPRWSQPGGSSVEAGGRPELAWETLDPPT